jgi:hypothetical protein
MGSTPIRGPIRVLSEAPLHDHHWQLHAKLDALRLVNASAHTRQQCSQPPNGPPWLSKRGLLLPNMVYWISDFQAWLSEHETGEPAIAADRMRLWNKNAMRFDEFEYLGRVYNRLAHYVRPLGEDFSYWERVLHPSPNAHH